MDLPPVAAVLTAALCLSCGQSTKLAASGTGDLSNGFAPRVIADAELVEACGSPEPETPGVFRRRPYVQQTSENGTKILFTTLSAADHEIEISEPDGTLVRRLAAELAHAKAFGAAAQYETRIDGLQANSIYCYAISGATSRVGFRTAPAADSGRAVRFLAFGDSGTGDWYQRAVATQLQTVPFDLVLHLGDIAYERGRAEELERFFFDVYPALTRSFPVFPVLGNHDYATDDALPLRSAFALPETAPPGFEERFYSFDWGNVHFVALDTERMNQAQVDWLDADLSANEREWVIVAAHRPPYSSGEHGSNETFRKVFGPLLAKHRVPLVLSGHEHNYERTRPIEGVTYIVTGGGGRSTRAVGESGFTAYAEDVLHFVYIEVKGRELVLHAIDGVGRQFDGARLVLD